MLEDFNQINGNQSRQTWFKRRRWWIIGGLILGVLLLVGIFWPKNNQKQYVTSKVESGNLVQTVSATGTVKSASEINLNFKVTGWVEKIGVKVGARVVAGQMLIQLDNQDMAIAVRQAQANLASAQAVLTKMLAGGSKEDLEVSGWQVDQAEVAYRNAANKYESLALKLDKDVAGAENDVQIAADNSAAAKVDLENTINTQDNSLTNLISSAVVSAENEIYTAKGALSTIDRILNDSDGSCCLGVGQYGSYYETKDSYTAANGYVAGAQTVLATAKQKNDYDSALNSLDATIKLLLLTSAALDDTMEMLNYSSTSIAFTLTELNTYKDAVKADQIKVNAAVSGCQTSKNNLQSGSQTYQSQIDKAVSAAATAENNLNAAKIKLEQVIASSNNQLNTAQAEVDSAASNLNLIKAQANRTKAAARPEDLKQQQAVIAQLAAAVDLAQKNLEDRTLKAPIDGVVTEVNYEISEDISLGKNAVAVLGENQLEVAVDISESDIIKVSEGDPVAIVLDAYGDDRIFTGKVELIDPAATVISDVSYYKVKVGFVCPEDFIVSTSINQILAVEPAANITPVLPVDPTKIERKNFSSQCLSGVKSGMSADIVINTDQKENVLAVPQRAILTRDDGSKYLRIISGKDFVEVDVKTGLRGDGGLVEITEGLKVGDEVVTFIKNGQ